MKINLILHHYYQVACQCIDKMEEEFDELKEALNDKSNIVHEAADTIYHILVTLEAADIKFEDVLKELETEKNNQVLKKRIIDNELRQK